MDGQIQCVQLCIQWKMVKGWPLLNPKKTKRSPNRSTRMTNWCCFIFYMKILGMFSDQKGQIRFCTKTDLLAVFLLRLLSSKEWAKSLGYLHCLKLKLGLLSWHYILVDKTNSFRLPRFYFMNLFLLSEMGVKLSALSMTHRCNFHRVSPD